MNTAPVDGSCGEGEPYLVALEFPSSLAVGRLLALLQVERKSPQDLVCEVTVGAGGVSFLTMSHDRSMQGSGCLPLEVFSKYTIIQPVQFSVPYTQLVDCLAVVLTTTTSSSAGSSTDLSSQQQQQQQQPGRGFKGVATAAAGHGMADIAAYFRAPSTVTLAYPGRERSLEIRCQESRSRAPVVTCCSLRTTPPKSGAGSGGGGFLGFAFAHFPTTATLTIKSGIFRDVLLEVIETATSSGGGGGGGGGGGVGFSNEDAWFSSGSGSGSGSGGVPITLRFTPSAWVLTATTVALGCQIRVPCDSDAVLGYECSSSPQGVEATFLSTHLSGVVLGLQRPGWGRGGSKPAATAALPDLVEKTTVALNAQGVLSVQHVVRFPPASASPAAAAVPPPPPSPPYVVTRVECFVLPVATTAAV